jgi:RNA polymerase sigma factor for flagellar operon FliA
MGGEDLDVCLEEQMPWVRAAARRVARRAGPAVDVDELVGLGSEGLVQAARSYDPGRGVPFAAWARLRVRGAMLDGLRAAAPGPRPVRLGRGGAAADPEARRRERFATARAEGLLFDAAEEAEGPVAAAPSDAGPEAVASRRQIRRLVARAVGELPGAEAELVCRHVLGGESLGQAARSLGLGADRAAQLYRRALGRLRAQLRDAAF